MFSRPISKPAVLTFILSTTATLALALGLMLGMAFSRAKKEVVAEPVPIYLLSAEVPASREPGARRYGGDTSLRAKILRAELAEISRKYAIDGRIDYCITERVSVADDKGKR